MRRPLALAISAAAVALVLALFAHGSVCGIESQRAECGPQGCTEPVRECTPYLHPFLWPALAASLASVALVWLGHRTATLSLGVAAGAAGGAWGWSLAHGVALLAGLIVAAGAMLPARAGRERDANLLALAAALLAVAPMLLVMALHATTPEPTFGKALPPPAWAYALAILGPVGVWLLLSARAALALRH